MCPSCWSRRSRSDTVDSATPISAARAAPDARAFTDNARSNARSTRSRSAFFESMSATFRHKKAYSMTASHLQDSPFHLALRHSICFPRRMLPSSPRIETIAVHAGMEGVAASGSHVQTIALSTTNPLTGVESGGESYENLATGGDLVPGESAVYQRLWQPGVARLEDGLSALEGAGGTVSFATGMAALAGVLIASVAAGKSHVVALRPIYGGTDHVLATGLLGTTVTWVNADGVADAIRPDTGLVILETPANPTLELTDIRAVVDAAGRVPVLVDNTFATPVLQRPIESGATLVLHSATKYLGGHGDAMGGTVSGPQDWIVRLRQVRAVTGGILHPFGAYLLHRGLRTLPLRVLAQQAAAADVAVRLVGHPALSRVLYPGLPGQDPQGLI